MTSLLLITALVGLLVLLLIAMIFAYKTRGKSLLAANEQLAELQVQLQNLQAALHTSENEKIFLSAKLPELEKSQELLQQRDQALNQQREAYNQMAQKLAIAETERNQQAQSQQEKLQLLQSSKEELSGAFEKLANQLLDQKSAKLQQNQEQFFSQTMQPLKEQLSEFRQRIDKVHETDSRDRVSLMSELNQLKQLNQQMSDDALNLTNALKGNQKFQGNWGEFVLEKVLEDSGLRSGYEYELQAKYYDEKNKLCLPDVVVHLPENKDIVIDAKVSLVDYQRYCEADDETEKQAALKGHIQSINNHIKGLSAKDYENLSGINTLDFVLLFVAIEPAFLLALENDRNLLQRAYDKHIVLVSPTTLLVTLRTVENLWRYERQNNNAEEIAKQAGALYDQCILVHEAMTDVGKHLDKAQQAYESSLKRLRSGRGNVINRIEKLKQLGAKTKKTMAAELIEDAAIDNMDTLDSSNASNPSNDKPATSSLIIQE